MIAVVKEMRLGTVESFDEFPQVEIEATVTIGEHGKVLSMDEGKIRQALEDAVSTYVTLEGGDEE